MNDTVDVISETYHEAGYVVRDEIKLSHFSEMEVMRPICDSSQATEAVEFADNLRDILDVHQSHTIRMQTAYTVGGDYIGDVDRAKALCDEHGIMPEKCSPADPVCSIGFSRKDGKWYGWSHRAICGFKVGDVVKEGDCCASPGCLQEYLDLHPERDLSLPVGFEAKLITDAKRMAIAFADSVG